MRLNTLLLPYPSLTVNKDDLVERVSTLPSAWLGKVEDGLRWFLHLDLAEP